MAPEQADPNKWGEVTPLTDVYALGVVAYQMLAGKVPFAGETLTVLHSHAYDPPPSPLESVPDLGDDLAAVLIRALAKPPGERYPDAPAMVAALCEVAEERARRAREQGELASLLERAQAARQAGEWLEVQNCCVRVLQIDRAQSDALQLMAEATAGLQRESEQEAERRRLAARYEKGVAAQAAGQWEAAIAALEEVVAGNPDYRDVGERLAQVRDERQRGQWYDEAIAHGEAERWPEACRAWLQVLSDRVDYRGGDAVRRFLEATGPLLAGHEALWERLKKAQEEREGLAEAVDQAQGEGKKLAKQGRALQKELDKAGELGEELAQARQALEQYDALATAVEKGKWDRAIELGQDLLPLVAKLDRPQDWLARAQKRLSGEKTGTEATVQIGPRQAESHVQTRVTEPDGKEMVLVEAGSFLYGEDKREFELPAFWIDRTPVTNAEYARFVQAAKRKSPRHWKGSTPPQETADHPVTYVSWHDAAAYAEWAGKRLPTEEEWEKAARGTDGRMYPWGDKWQEGLCNTSEAGMGGTTAVGQYSPAGDSPYGCVDIAGNVWEWTNSWHAEDQVRRVLRGGSWGSGQGSARCADRDWNSPGDSLDNVGFRCVSPISLS